MSSNKNEMKRSPLFATFASLAMPGLGHIYNGKISKGIVFYLAFAFLIPLSAWSSLRFPVYMLSPIVLIGAFITFLFYLWAAFDSYKTSKRIGTNFNPTPINNTYSYIAIAVFSHFFVFGQLFNYTQTSLVANFRVPTSSMVPGILPGEHFFANKQFNRPGSQDLLRGDIVVFINPNKRSQYFVKRVIGLPGDEIEIVNQDVKVNGILISALDLSNGSINLDTSYKNDFPTFTETSSDGRSYKVIHRKDEKQELTTFKVPNGQTFVLGDNRSNAFDSRNFGFVPLVDIVGRAEQVWLSPDLKRVGTTL